MKSGEGIVASRTGSKRERDFALCQSGAPSVLAVADGGCDSEFSSNLASEKFLLPRRLALINDSALAIKAPGKPQNKPQK